MNEQKWITNTATTSDPFRETSAGAEGKLLEAEAKREIEQYAESMGLRLEDVRGIWEYRLTARGVKA